VAKEKMKMYADRKAKKSDVETGDHVLLKQKKKNKFSTSFSRKEYEVTERAGVKVMLKAADGQTLCRHVVAVRKIVPRKVDEETPVVTESNSNSREGSPNTEPLPQEAPAPITVQVPPAAPKLIPVISVPKQKVANKEVPKPKKRSARLMMKEAVRPPEDDVALKEAFHDEGMTSSSEEEDDAGDDKDYIPGD